jgi:hypothetical protein
MGLAWPAAGSAEAMDFSINAVIAFCMQVHGFDWKGMM